MARTYTDTDRPGMPTWLRIVLWIVGVVVALGLIGFFVMFGPPHVARSFAKPEFCARCHTMQLEYDTFKSGTHASAVKSCNDCHLPNNNPVSHYTWDAIVGIRDLALTTVRAIPSTITTTPRSERWLKANCIRCHAPFPKSHPGGTNPQGLCWRTGCHPEVTHKQQQGGTRPEGSDFARLTTNR